MKIPLFTISLLLTLPAQDLKSQSVNPGAPARVPLPPPPVDPARVPSSASVEVETDAAQNPAPTRAGAKKPVLNKTPSTVVVKPQNPFSGFRHIDRDENGTLSLKELTQAFRRSDTDFDGLLSLDEFQRGIVDQPLDAGGAPDPPQIIVVPPAAQEASDDASAGASTPQNRGRIRPGEAIRRQSDPVDNNGDNQDDDLDDLDDVDLNDIDQNDVDGVIQSNRSPDAKERRNATTDLNRVGSEPRHSNETEPNATGTERRNDDSNATPRDSTRPGASTSPNNRPRSSTQQRSGASSSGNASTRDSSTNSNRNNRSSGNTGQRKATGSGGAGTGGASAGGGGGTSGGSSSSGGGR